MSKSKHKITIADLNQHLHGNGTAFVNNSVSWCTVYHVNVDAAPFA